jgi:hypothetical protein
MRSHLEVRRIEQRRVGRLEDPGIRRCTAVHPRVDAATGRARVDLRAHPVVTDLQRRAGRDLELGRSISASAATGSRVGEARLSVAASCFAIAQSRVDPLGTARCASHAAASARATGPATSAASRRSSPARVTAAAGRAMVVVRIAPRREQKCQPKSMHDRLRHDCLLAVDTAPTAGGFPLLALF